MKKIIKVSINAALGIATEILYALSIILAGFLICLCLTVNYSFSQPISSSELINNAKQYDGKLVTYEGEIIGDRMARGKYAWINVHDGANAVGIWISNDLLSGITYAGSYKSKGDWVEITGDFQRACPQHGGDLDIHARALKKVREGGPIAESMDPGKKNLALALLGVLGLIWILRRLKTK